MRNFASVISFATLAVTIVCSNGLQTASVPQVAAFSTTFALSIVMTVIALRRGGLINRLFALFTVVVQFGLFIFS
jgi:hypothetical protein